MLRKAMFAAPVVLGAALAAHGAQATVITYDTWTTNEGSSGNYILTVDDAPAGKFAIDLTVNPWNAEALGLFVDLGNNDITGPVGLTNVMPAGEVSLFATDTTSDGCGAGCNLNGLGAPVAVPDGEWELVFRLGAQGFDGIQTFSFEINDLGLAIDDFGLVGIRAQQLCEPGDTLPDGKCGGSDKSYGNPTPQTVETPEPGTLALVGLGLLGLAARRR